MGLVLGTAQLHGSLTLTLHTSVHGKRVRPQPQQELAAKPCGFPAPLASSRSDSWQKKRDSIHGIHRIKKTPQTRTHPQWWQRLAALQPNTVVSLRLPSLADTLSPIRPSWLQRLSSEWQVLAKFLLLRFTKTPLTPGTSSRWMVLQIDQREHPISRVLKILKVLRTLLRLLRNLT